MLIVTARPQAAVARFSQMGIVEEHYSLEYVQIAPNHIVVAGIIKGPKDHLLREKQLAPQGIGTLSEVV